MALIVYGLLFCAYQILNNYPPQYRLTSDDATYPYLAQRFLNGTFREYNNFILSERILQILPMALFIKVFGVSIYSTSGWNILSYLGMVFVMFYLGRALFNDMAGIFASLLTAFYPLIASMAYLMQPDMPMVFFSALFALSLVYCKNKKSKGWGLLCGMLLISLPLITPIGAVIVILGVIYLIASFAYEYHKYAGVRQEEKYIVYGMIFAGMCALIFNYMFSGNPVITVTASSDFYGNVGCGSNQNGIVNTTLYNKFGIPVSCGNQSPSEYAGGSANVYIDEMFSYVYSPFNDLLLQLLYSKDRTTTYYYVAIPALLYIFKKKEKNAYFMAFWLIAGLLYLSFGPAKISFYPPAYLFLEESWKYIVIVAVPTILIISVALAKFLGAGGKKQRAFRLFLTVLIILFLLITSMDADLFI